ncbi:MAG: TetR/AcrR family transcriptional regulator [Candidatus Cloacimonetes bacterium]|nr:TetR/AcrR family transcriptional regulator [Candidatus Cloacimonadota bacterium]
MQRLKDEIKKAILENAEKLFLEKGYEGCSMRDLAATIPMSVSNLYKYFPDKFTLYKHFVFPHYDLFLNRIDGFMKEENDGNYTDENISYVSENLFRRLLVFRTSFLLLMENTNVPQYGDFKEKLCDKMTRHIIEGTKADSGFDPFLIKVIVQNMWDGLYYIFKAENEEKVYESRVRHFITYHFKGLSLFHDID